MKVQTYLPIFTGFYNNPYFEDRFFEQFEQDKYELAKIENFHFEQLTFDYEQYYRDVAYNITNEVESILIDLKLCKSIKFETLVSPKYYNYSNDSINIEIELTNENIKEIQVYLNDNIVQSKKYLKDNYTSRDGFISSYSNEFTDWLIFTDNFTNFEQSHYLGSILQFITENEGINESNLEIDYKFYTEYLTEDNEENKEFLNLLY
jgi:hypothetical protein